MRLFKLLAYIVPILFIVYSYYPLTHSKWAVIDDHEIINFIGNQNSLPALDIPKTLSQTEIGSGNSLPRFRPAYYGLRVGLSSLIGNHPEIWHIFHILILITFAIALIKVCLEFTNPIITLGFSCFALSQPYISDIVSRLGPGENYALLGVSLIMFAGRRAYLKHQWDAVAGLLLLLGIILAAGSKENFLILSIFPVYLLFFSKIKVSNFTKFASILSLGYVGWIAFTIFTRLSVTKTDVYGNPTDTASRFKLIFSLIQRVDFLSWIVCTLILFAVIHFLFKRNQLSHQQSDSLKKYCWAILLLLGLYSFQYIFYAGKWPDLWGGGLNYYSFPGTLAKEMAILLAILACIMLATIIFSLSHKSIFVISLLVFSAYLVPFKKNFREANLISTKYSEGTQEFDKKLQQLFKFIESHPSAVIYLDYPADIGFSDFEPNVSIERFIRATGFNGPILRTANRELLKTNQPQDEQSLADNCFAIGMNGPATSNCSHRNYIGYFWGPPQYKE
jgi:hypothetical protein